MAKQSFEGIIRPIMTLLKVAPYNLEILKESASLFLKMSAINGTFTTGKHMILIMIFMCEIEESWGHLFQMKGLQHFVDAMINLKVGR
jgi:hypothetical protein